jgi:hypothetical protein
MRGRRIRSITGSGWLSATLALIAACALRKPPALDVPPAASFSAAPSGVVAITHATVVPMVGDGVLADHTVVVRGDRIVALAPSGELEVPAEATVIDGTGKWLMPGLADMHVHIWNQDDLTLFLAAGVTTVRNMFGERRHLVWRSHIARGEWIGPTIVTAGPIIDGEPPAWPGSTVLDDPADADRVVAEQQAAGYDFLKPYARLSQNAYAALAAAARRHGMALAGHVPHAVGLAGVLAAGQRSIEHLDGWMYAMAGDAAFPRQRALPSTIHAALSQLDRARLPPLIEQAIAAGAWTCPTLTVGDRIASLDDRPALKRRVVWLDKVAPAVTPSATTGRCGRPSWSTPRSSARSRPRMRRSWSAPTPATRSSFQARRCTTRSSCWWRPGCRGPACCGRRRPTRPGSWARRTRRASSRSVHAPICCWWRATR